MIVPRRVFLTAGQGQHPDRIHAFELALRDAGIEQCNLVLVSSVLPPGCRIVDREAGTAALVPGAITFCVMARDESDCEDAPLSTSVCIAVPKDGSRHGYIGECAGNGRTPEDIEAAARELAQGMLVTSLDIDTSRAYEVCAASPTISCVTRAKAGVWNVAVAVAVFLED
ncbi:MAG: arginine decarboxylase, pyruvoyl-dependent [Candidatus Undinarchaeales archaeon]|jgi:arginine decarboxylase|nr:arginine decarboxylase, pyruvoyl-dependent [Candidatus Undinarchaeales archaeon]MDP7492129.1 arginine decarboxylase, pyruvoyl-dependent [Candidatus Undinarchaeales archaeon]